MVSTPCFGKVQGEKYLLLHSVVFGCLRRGSSLDLTLLIRGFEGADFFGGRIFGFMALRVLVDEAECLLADGAAVFELSECMLT